MKWDFNNSDYVKFWNSDEAAGAFQIMWENGLIRTMYGFWKGQFAVDPYTTPRNNSGDATFTSKMRSIASAGVLDMRARLGDSIPRDKKGVKAYTGSIPDFIARSFVETAMEREYKEKMFESYFGNDSQIVLAYADEVQNMINDADQTMNNMAAQALSLGSVSYNLGAGIKLDDIYTAKIPAENFITAGASIWSDSTARILDQMRKIEDDTYLRWGVKPAMKWQMPKTFFLNVFLQNEQVIEQVRYWKSMNNVLLPESVVLTTDMAMEAIGKFEGISPIELVEEAQMNEGSQTKGWADNIVVLRPQGFAGVIRHTEILEERLYPKFGSSVIGRAFARVGESGLYTLMNTELNNGNLREWHTDLLVAAVPTLDEFLYHVIVDTAEADS